MSSVMWNGVAQSVLRDEERPPCYRAIVRRVREEYGWEVLLPAPPEPVAYRTEAAARTAALRALGIDPLEAAG